MTTSLGTAQRHELTPRSTGSGRVTLARTVVAEWIKFRTVRSTVWTLVATGALMVGVSVLAAWGATTDLVDPGTSTDGLNVAQVLSAGYQLAQLGVAVLGVLIITTEYSTGLVRATFTAVPGRLPVLWAKACVLSAAILVATVVGMALAYVATIPFHDELAATFDLSDAQTLRMTIGLPLYLVAIGLLALATGAVLRHSAAALSGAIALLLVIENVMTIIPLRAIEVISPLLPSTAGRRVLFDSEMITAIDATTDAVHLSPWQGYAVLVAWVSVLLGLAAVLLRRRDA